MSSESKYTKNESTAESIQCLQPMDIKNLLERSIKEGYRDGYLSLSYIGLDDNTASELCEWLIKLEIKVKVLALSCNNLTSKGVSMIFNTLRISNSDIEAIDLNMNPQIDDSCMNSLGEYIKSNTHIQEIYLEINKISDAGIEILLPLLEGNSTFKLLMLDENNKITDKSIPLLMKMIETSHIEDISINKTSISERDILIPLLACNVFKYGSPSLKLSYKGMKDGTIKKVCEMIKKFDIDKLKEIKLERNQVTSIGASTLFDTLKECKSVVSQLNLGGNQIDDECMKQLGEYLQDNNHLEVLQTGANNITDKGVEVLVEYLIGNAALKNLCLQRNEKITDKSVLHLIEIAKRSHVTQIYLSDTSISNEKKQIIELALSIPIDQREIPIKSNTKSAAKFDGKR